MKKEKEVLEVEIQEEQKKEKEIDKLVPIRKGTLTKYRMKSETEKYIKDGWVIV
jgi:hypothetical protein